MYNPPSSTFNHSISNPVYSAGLLLLVTTYQSLFYYNSSENHCLELKKLLHCVKYYIHDIVYSILEHVVNIIITIISNHNILHVLQKASHDDIILTHKRQWHINTHTSQAYSTAWHNKWEDNYQHKCNHTVCTV